MKKKIESYQGAAGGWGAVKSVANAVRKQMDIPPGCYCHV